MNKFIFLIITIVSALHLLIAYNLPSTISENNFPYKDILYKYFHFYPLTSFANFDGYQYISIAKNGYGELLGSFFPLYPLLVSLVAHSFVESYILAGVFVSLACFAVGLVYFYKVAKVILKNDSQAKWAVIFLVTFPTAFFYQMIYTESLFLLVSSAALYYLYTKRYLWAALFAVLASLTKTQGVLLLIPFILVMLGFNRHWFHAVSFKKVLHFVQRKYKVLFLAFAPLYGLLLYSGYLYIKFNDPLYFYHAQAAFNLERSVGTFVLFPQVMYRYVKIFLTTPVNFTYAISILEFVVFTVVLLVLFVGLVKLIRKKKNWDSNTISLYLYSLVALIFPTVTGTFVSVPRFALISLGFFLVLATIQNIFLKIVLLVLLVLGHIVFFSFFLKGYFVS